MTTIKGWGPLPGIMRDVAGSRALHRILNRHDVPLSVLKAPHRRIPLVKMVRVFEAAARETGDYGLGQRIGAGTSVHDYGEWGAYAFGARNLKEGLHRLCRSIWVHESESRMFLSEREHYVVWSYATGLASAEPSRQFYDHLLKPMLDFVRAYLGLAWQPDWLEMPYVTPKRNCGPEHGLCKQVRYEQPAFGVPIRRTELSSRKQASAPRLLPVTSVDLLKHRPSTKDDFCSDVMEAIDLCLLAGFTDIGATSRALDLGPRTLQRQLATQGVTFRDLLQQARKRRALALLRETDKSIMEISHDLGYGDPENFTRAFRGWQGISPSVFRAELGCPDHE